MTQREVTHYLPALILFLIVLSGCPAQAQVTRERHERLRASVDGGDLSAATADLQSMSKTEPGDFALNNYDYLHARISERRGDRATAAANFQRVLARNSLLAQYALWHLAEFARSIGNLTLEREQLRRLVATAPLSLLRQAALARIAESFFESGDYASAISTLRPRDSDGKPVGSQARGALALIGEAYMRSGQKEAAREIFNSLVTKLPDASQPDDYALAGVRGLDRLDGGSIEDVPKSAPQLSEDEHLRRAFVYHFNRDFAGARLHYQAIIARFAQSSNMASTLYQTGRAFYQELRFDDAINYFNRVLTEFPQSPNARDALSYTAAAYARSKRTDEALVAYQRYIDRYTDAPNQERGILNIIDTLREAGRDEEALRWIEKARERLKGRAGAALALFSRAKIHLAQGAWEAALADIDALRVEADLGGMRLPGGTNKTEVAFARAYTLEQLGRTDEAINAYLAFPDGRKEYYGGRATRRLRALATREQTRAPLAARLDALRTEAQQVLASGQMERARVAAQNALRLTEDEATRRELLDIARRAYASLPDYNRLPAPRVIPAGRQDVLTVEPPPRATTLHQALADELLFLGLYDEGTPELAVAENSFDNEAVEDEAVADRQEGKASAENGSERKSSVQSPAPSQLRVSDQAYTLAVYFKRGDSAAHAIRFAEPLWKKIPGDYLLELAPREMVELLYPAPYAAALLEYAPSRGVDPRFVLAIARQESRFRPEAKSSSAARGLLQFIPSTADVIAAQLGKPDFRQDDLYDPHIAALFGAQYMGNLFKQFPDMPQAVAASYNGGEDNVERWVARARSNDPDRYVLEISFTQSKDYVYKVLPNFWVYQMLYTDQLQRR
ncbi:MAG TPA: transglycosylase SLT domain-containing protein [Pyrinomonadaceae bacterium]|jgi:soluble lytic murein transglycosylase